jgi:pimeloyl-ACP methyl ester carboxylesterase
VPIVLVHGNPETAAIWDDLRGYLGSEDVVALSPPGFGSAVPEGFGATSDEYVDWLATELDRLLGPIDLVGHDWGGGHVARLVNARPELVRSWAIDIAGCFDPDYVWHERAQVWQTPEVGETAVAQQLATPKPQLAAAYERLGLSRATAEACAAAYSPEMARCILSLYRSAAQPRMAEWGAQLAGLRSRPGLVIIPTEDQYTGGEVLARRTAEWLGAQVAVLSGLGHWWMCQDPRRGADVIASFVASLDATQPSA